MLAAVVRSGVVEAVHDGAVAVVDPDGSVLASSGDIDRSFFGRSSFKPFQAQVALELGAELSRAHLAIVCASHPATPAHVALVSDVLARVGLDEAALQTPAVYPYSVGALHYVGPHDAPRRIWHNCSGKHAGMLAACVASDLDTGGYLSPEHPLQAGIADVIGEVTGTEVGTPGIDGCGAPVYRTSVRHVATAFARLASDPRFKEVRTAMHSHPRLIGDVDWIDVMVMTRVGGVAKGGAEGLVGIALEGGLGLAVKCWDGSPRGVHAGAIEALRQLHRIDGRAATAALQPVAGGDERVGTVEPRLEMSWNE